MIQQSPPKASTDRRIAQWRRKYAVGNNRPVFSGGAWWQSDTGASLVLVGVNHTFEANDPFFQGIGTLVGRLARTWKPGLPRYVVPEAKPASTVGTDMGNETLTSMMGECGALLTHGLQHGMKPLWLEPHHGERERYLTSVYKESKYIRYVLMGLEVLHVINAMDLNSLDSSSVDEFRRCLELYFQKNWQEVDGARSWYTLEALGATHRELLGEDLDLTSEKCLNELNACCRWTLIPGRASPVFLALNKFREQKLIDGLANHSRTSQIIATCGSMHLNALLEGYCLHISKGRDNWVFGNLLCENPWQADSIELGPPVANATALRMSAMSTRMVPEFGPLCADLDLPTI